MLFRSEQLRQKEREGDESGEPGMALGVNFHNASFSFKQPDEFGLAVPTTPAEAAAMQAGDGAAVQQARAGVDAAPAGKGTESDIEQLRADLGGADADINAARSAVSSEDFDQAQARAKSAQDKAAQVASGVQAATQKYEELVEKIQGGWVDFDACISTPDMMKLLRLNRHTLPP